MFTWYLLRIVKWYILRIEQSGNNALLAPYLRTKVSLRGFPIQNLHSRESSTCLGLYMLKGYYYAYNPLCTSSQ